MQEICRPGSEGGAKLSFVPTPIRHPLRALSRVGKNNAARTTKPKFLSRTVGFCERLEQVNEYHSHARANPRAVYAVMMHARSRDKKG